MRHILKNMSKRESSIAYATVLIVIVSALYVLILEPIAREWQALNFEMRSKAATLKKDLAILAERKALESDYSKFSKYVKSEKNEEETAAEILSYLEDLSRSDSCLILNIKPVGIKDHGKYKEIMVDLSSEGSLSQFTKFLYDIENTKSAILKVRHFVLTSKAGQEGALRGSFIISKIIIE